MSTPPVTLSLMVTNAEELATMLAVLRQHDQRDKDRVKQAHAERDEAMTSAIGWRKSAEVAQQRFIEATNQLEKITRERDALNGRANQLQRTVEEQSNARGRELHSNQLEVDRLSGIATKALADTRDAIRERNSLADELQAVTGQRDELSELLADANTKLDQLAGDTCQHAAWEYRAGDPGAAHARDVAERRRLLGNVADLHPDEDPRDHVTH